MTEMRAIWNGELVASAKKENTVVVENNVYFPPTAIKKEFFKDSNHHTTCHWKGEASYYHVTVDGEKNENAAWYYPDPLPEAEKKGIKNFVAFWNGVEIVEA